MSPAADTVEDIIKNNKVVVFSEEFSDDCIATQYILESLKANAYIMDLDYQENKDAIQQYLQNKTNRLAVPFIFIKEKFIGGYEELRHAYQRHQLQKWLE